MPGPIVGLGASVVLAPGAAGPPDSGVISAIIPPFISISGIPAATAGSICTLVNSLTGIPYPLPIPPLGASLGVMVTGRGLVRMGDIYLLGAATLTVLGPPIVPTITDLSPP